MLLSKTPFRISFAGGGSDYFNNSSNMRGRVLVTTINKYIYVALNERYNMNLEFHILRQKLVN